MIEKFKKLFSKKKRESLRERFIKVRYGNYPDININYPIEEIEKEFRRRIEKDFPTYSI